MLSSEDFIRLGINVVQRDLPADPVRIGRFNVPRDMLLGHTVRVGRFVLSPDLWEGGRPRITSIGPARGVVGQPFSFQIVATNSPTSFAATGLPPGLSINPTTGEISGSPTELGTTNVTISATNDEGTGSRSLSIQIGNVPTITSTSATGVVSTAFSYQILATGNPTSFTATGLPGGLTMNSSGRISGTPTATGTTTVQVTATNIYGSSAPHPLSITITEAPVIPQAFYGALPNGTTVAELLEPNFIRGLAANMTNPTHGTIMSAPVPTGSQGVAFAYPASLGGPATLFQNPPGFDVVMGMNRATLAVPPGPPDSAPIDYLVIYQRVALAYPSPVTFVATI